VNDEILMKDGHFLPRTSIEFSKLILELAYFKQQLNAYF